MYRELTSELAPLETFDTSLFVGDEVVPQEVCDLVLSLALVYNDLRSVMLAIILLARVKVETTTPSPDLGQWAGDRLTLSRLEAGVLHELLALIEENAAALQHPAFKKVIRHLSKVARAAWNDIEAVALRRRATGTLGKALLMMRNKVSFHYSPKELGRGYRTCFVAGSNPRIAYVSRGEAMKSTRFYFADAAAEAYMHEVATDEAARQMLFGRSELTDQVNIALHEIVSRFGATRNIAWSQLPEGS